MPDSRSLRPKSSITSGKAWPTEAKSHRFSTGLRYRRMIWPHWDAIRYCRWDSEFGFRRIRCVPPPRWAIRVLACTAIPASRCTETGAPLTSSARRTASCMACSGFSASLKLIFFVFLLVKSLLQRCVWSSRRADPAFSNSRNCSRRCPQPQPIATPDRQRQFTELGQNVRRGQIGTVSRSRSVTVFFFRRPNFPAPWGAVNEGRYAFAKDFSFANKQVDRDTICVRVLDDSPVLTVMLRSTLPRRLERDSKHRDSIRNGSPC